MEHEQWKTVPDLPDYAASSIGRIRREKPGRGTKAGRILAQSKINSGYMVVKLSVNNTPINRLVHRLVYSAFHGAIPAQMDVNHKNSDRTDNRPENLDVMTRRENIQHAIAAGRMNTVGVNNPQSKITPEVVRAIRADHSSGLGYKRLAKKYGLSWGCVRSVATRTNWKHVE